MEVSVKVIVLAGLLAVSAASAQEQGDEIEFRALIQQVQSQRGNQLPDKALMIEDAKMRLTDCPTAYLELKKDEGHSRPDFARYSQYIFNRTYSWDEIPTAGGHCIYMTSPMDRSLTRSEADDFYTATKSEFPVVSSEPPQKSAEANPDPRTQHDPMPMRNSDKDLQKKNDASIGTLGAPKPNLSGLDPRVPVTQNIYPYNLITYVTSNGTQGSAVQVSPYVYMTAAHIVVNAATGYTYSDIKIYPGYGIAPVATSFQAADISYDSGYTAIPAHADQYAHDIAFIRAAIAHPQPYYPQRYVIRSSADGFVGPISPCPLGLYSSDPYLYAEDGEGWKTWYAGSMFPTSCRGWGTGIDNVTIVAGYPEVVNGNPITPQIIPYMDDTGFLLGTSIPSPNLVAELIHTCTGCLLFTGFGAWVSPGDSGGPVFVQDGDDTLLMGIIGSQQLNDDLLGGVGAGEFDYNYSFVDFNVNWTPATLVQITSPSSGGTYSPSSIPNLAATAGLLTSQLQWTSSIDGPLGSGGTIIVGNRLSAGQQTLTATVQGSTIAKASIQFTVSAPPPAVATVSPTQVVVAAYAPPGPFVVTYNASGYSSIDWWKSDNGSAFQFVFTTGGSGNFPGSILANTSYRFKMFPHGNSTNQLGNTVTVTGVLAAQTTFSLAPAFNIVATGRASGNVLIPATASPSTGPFNISWNAPGYSTLDLQGKINGGPWRTPVWITPSGNTGDNMPLGTTYHYRLFPHGDTTNVLATLDVTGMAAPAPTFSVNPAHVIVPVGATSGSFSLTWNAPGYQSLDYSGQINQSGTWSAPFNIPASTTTGDTLTVGTRYDYRFYPHGDTTHIIGTLSVTASH